mgnify:CR=1 FL=1
MLSRYFLRLSYNGTEFSGWQFQKNAISIQQTLNEKISMLLHEHIELTGCGRTDAGVHARKFYAHFMSEKDDLEGNEKVIFRMNKILPQGIAIRLDKPLPCGQAEFDEMVGILGDVLAEAGERMQTASR